MRRLKYLYLIVSTLLVSSCYEVSEEDLFEDFVSNLVVEAKINNLNQPNVFYISYSVEADNTIDAQPISDAVVTVTDNTGISEILTTQEPGIYILNEMQGVVGNEYSMFIRIDGEVYKAKETMQKAPVINKTEVSYIDKFVPQEGNYIKLFIEKPSAKTSYYKLEVSNNQELYNTYNDLIIFEDSYSIDTIEYLIPYAFEINDTVMVDLHVISQEMYQYYFELSKQTNNTFRNIQPPMQNPPNNISNSALGYFQVSAITRLNIIIR